MGRVKRGVHIKITHRKASFPVSYFYVHLSGFARRTHFRARPCCMLCIQMALISRTRPCCMLCIQMARTSLILYYPSFPVSYFYVHLSGFARRTHFRARPCCMLCIQMAPRSTYSSSGLARKLAKTVADGCWSSCEE